MVLAYNRLLKAIQPVFSGAVNTLINKLDSRKAIDSAAKAKPSYNDKEQ